MALSLIDDHGLPTDCWPYFNFSEDGGERSASQLGRSGMAITAGFLGAERVLQRVRSVRGQDDAAEIGRRTTPIVKINFVAYSYIGQLDFCI